MNNKTLAGRIGIEGVLMVLAPFPLFFVVSEEGIHYSCYEFLLSIISSIFIFCSALTLLRKPAIGKIFGMGAVILGYISALRFVLANQSVTLVATVFAITAFFAYFDFTPRLIQVPPGNQARLRKRAFWGNIALLPVLILNVMFSRLGYESAILIMTASVFIAFSLYFSWTINYRSVLYIAVSTTSIMVILLMLYLSLNLYIPAVAAMLAIAMILILPREKTMVESNEQWWEVLLNHPARMLLSTFFVLCVCGSILLLLPFSSSGHKIAVVDAVFTSVSAVCVTGLVVLDTPIDFSIFGQSSILLLIQLGGLGIMSIATVALHVMGKRMSLKQERLMTSMIDTPNRDLINSLALILRYTFIVESIGALLLALLFYAYGDNAGYAIYRGVFTAISAFCNAGFALQSNSLVSYQSSPLILHIVALLIILGGIAPAAVLFFPKWVRGKVTPIPARIALIATVIMLLGGMLFILMFEWNGLLEGLSVFDKVNNAWFQSATLRTAGFNSINLEHAASPTYLLMVAFMFIGGSPGGTAGGIKTTTVGILAMTFFSNIINKRSVIIQNRRINHATIYRAVTIVISGIIVWFLGVIMLEVTQRIPAKDLIFEVTSALATVGLTIGATPLLDEIGKIIIIITMFAGRIGPMTLFMLLSEDTSSSGSEYIDENISLT